ncbi:MAG: IS21 family transposase, partial [Sandaracinaceae bacterium]|nr:IS21 family transposase [Sandaracinaceae bacterium]
MTISSEQRATIRRLFYAEHWKVGTIAAEMELAADTVKRAILTDAFVSNGANARSTLLDPYKPMVAMTLEQYPRLRATRLYDMLVARGFLGSVRQVRRYVSKVRPPRGRKAYLRTRTMPGEFGQVDWGSFGKVSVRGGERSLSLFLMALPYSRALAGEFTYDQRMDAFLRGHGHAFEEFEGAPRVMLYDNLKSVVLERIGDHVRFHDDLLEFAGHYHYMPRPCRPYCPEEKGTVERAIQYIRGSFFEGRKFSSLDDLNAQFREWLDTHAMARVHPTDEERRTVREVFEEERARLLPLPAHQPTTDRVQPIRSGKQPYVRFDGNDYSIPHTLVRVPLTLAASDTRVRVLDGVSVV